MSAPRKITIYSASTFEKSLSPQSSTLFPDRHHLIETKYRWVSQCDPQLTGSNQKPDSGCTRSRAQITRHYVFSFNISLFSAFETASPLLIQSAHLVSLIFYLIFKCLYFSFRLRRSRTNSIAHSQRMAVALVTTRLAT